MMLRSEAVAGSKLPKALRNLTRRIAVCVLWALSGPLLLASDAEIQVNSFTPGGQYKPDVATEANGAFVIVWNSNASNGSDDSYGSVQAQRFASDGSFVGGQFQVNTLTEEYQEGAAVAIAPDGAFVVAWQSEDSAGSDSEYSSIQIRRFSSHGSGAGTETQVNEYTTSSQTEPAVAAFADGSVVVTWRSDGSFSTDNDRGSIHLRRFLSDGSGLAPIQVNTYTTSNQINPDVAAFGDGSFVIVWSSDGSYGTDALGTSIQGQLYLADGSANGTQFQINSYTTGSQNHPRVASESNNGFIVTWGSSGSPGSDTSGFSALARRFAADGTAISSEFQVNSFTTAAQSDPDIAVSAAGSFAIAWQGVESAGSDQSGRSVHVRTFRADGTPAEEFQLNTLTTGEQLAPTIAARGDGDFVATWSSAVSGGSDTLSSSIQLRRVTSPIFDDGFESGNTSRWSLDSNRN